MPISCAFGSAWNSEIRNCAMIAEALGLVEYSVNRQDCATCLGNRDGADYASMTICNVLRYRIVQRHACDSRGGVFPFAVTVGTALETLKQHIGEDAAFAMLLQAVREGGMNESDALAYRKTHFSEATS